MTIPFILGGLMGLFMFGVIYKIAIEQLLEAKFDTLKKKLMIKKFKDITTLTKDHVKEFDEYFDEFMSSRGVKYIENGYNNSGYFNADGKFVNAKEKIELLKEYEIVEILYCEKPLGE